MANGLPATGFLTLDREVNICPISDLVTRYYIRATVLDRAGVLAQMASILGNLQISIASVIQKEVDLDDGTAELVITTYHSKERDVQQALMELEGLDVVKEIGSLLRVEE
jgi:homoserine dehydrogenase